MGHPKVKTQDDLTLNVIRAQQGDEAAMTAIITLTKDRLYRFLIYLSGNGEVIQPSDGIIAIGSGSGYALAAARALLETATLSPREIVERALAITGDICIYSNRNTHIEVLE